FCYFFNILFKFEYFPTKIEHSFFTQFNFCSINLIKKISEIYRFLQNNERRLSGIFIHARDFTSAELKL
ncbi:MAG: hypothetical protein SPG48_10795, partial [Treponema sp.]|nr:hypothetical protein [Treponema sp.]